MQLPTLQYTHSSASVFRRCPRSYRFAYIEGLRKRQNKSGPLWFGNAMHLGLELLEGGEAIDKVLAAVEARMVGDGLFFDADHEVDVLTSVVKVQELLCGYVAYYADPSASSPGRAAVEVEKSFAIPILRPDGSETEWILAGKLDLLFKDDAGRLILLDHKTTSDDIGPGSDYWRRLMLDHQMSLYYYAARRLGYPVEGVVYDVIRKPLIRVRAKSGESYEGYRQRLRSDIADDPGKYFARNRTTRTDKQLETFAIELFQHASMMAGCKNRGFFPRNTEACWMPYRCQYFPICSTGGWEPGQEVPAEFEIVTDLFPELTQKEISDE